MRAKRNQAPQSEANVCRQMPSQKIGIRGMHEWATEVYLFI